MHCDEGGRRGQRRAASEQRTLARSGREAERAIVDLLLADPHVWTVAEIEREMGAGAAEVGDALGGLRRAGLVNIAGCNVTASRSARAMDELDV